MNHFKIFVVDDDVYYLNMFKQHLLNLGCENVTLFESGTDCLNHLDEKPDVIFLDHQMDTLNGYEVLKKIKRVNPNLYVVIISAQENMKTAIDSLKHGAFDYLQKGDDEMMKVEQVLKKIEEVKDLLQRSKPSFIKTIFKFL